MRHHGAVFRGSWSFLPNSLLILGLVIMIFGNSSRISAQNPPITGNHQFALVRVEFQADTSDLTTGIGQFNLETAETITDTVIDPPPHNAAYFRDQTKALHNYYSRVSDGLLTIDWQNSPIFPAEEDAAYTLSKPMEEYGKGFTDSTQQQHWADLLWDTYQACKNDVSFGNYSTLVIFHAGVGQDFDIPLDDTPYDIQSAYLDREFMETHYPDEQLSELQNAGIEHVLILPETQSQLEISIGLTGTYALLFGSRIGLPALYNTESGQSVVGKFGLMDLGSNNANGIAPAYPTAWTRLNTGWAGAYTVTNSGSYSVQSAEAQGSTPEILKVPINASEYYLVENRLRQTRESSLDSFMVNYDTLFVERDPETHVITSVEEYDAGLPGDGLLIWHVDENVIQANLSTNTINTNPNRRGVDIEEADGAQDIGEYYGDFSGGVENGWFFDLWFAKNEGFFHLNPDYETDADSTIGFEPTTFPATFTNSGAYSGISITEIPAADSLVTIRIDFQRTIPQFPLYAPKASGPNLLAVQSKNVTYLVNTITNAGSPDSIWVEKITASGTQTIQFSGALSGNPSGKIQSITSRIDGQGQLVVGALAQVQGAESVNISEYLIAGNGTVTPDHLGAFGGSASTQLIDDTTGYIFATTGDTVYRIDNTGNIDWNVQIPDSIHSLSINGAQEIYAGTNFGLYKIGTDQAMTLADTGAYREIVSSGNTVVFGRGDEQLSFYSPSGTHEYLPANPALPEYTKIAAADVDGDGKNEVIALTRNNNIWQLIAYNKNSAMGNNFPIDLSGEYTSQNIAVADINADDIPEIFTVNDSGRVYGYGTDGTLLPHFPIDVGAPVSSPLSIVREQGRAWLILQDTTGAVYGYYAAIDPSVQAGDVIWSGRHGNPANTRFVPEMSGSVTPTDANTIRRAYIYPNPIRSDNATLRVEVNTGDRIRIRVYDFSGRRIQRWELGVESDVSVYEIPWDTSNIPSGVYFAEVKVSNGGSEAVKIVKIAKVR
ncbi:MAG: hypothetical protein MAGBODY4_01573 [Candidatus Marinimicrobia bacterium]|nr:hypothetical protein [Candidatus Neomarinimicrobiota bacterium]